MFSCYNAITKSLNAKFFKYDLQIEGLDWVCPENSNIVGLDIGKKKSRSSTYNLVSSKSTRGRKKKERKEKKKFPSTINFIIRKEVIREIEQDSYSYTSIKLTEKTEKIFKDYNIFLFNKGRIICVGVKENDCSDFYWCIKFVVDFLVEKGLKREDLEIHDVKVTLENYRFELKDKNTRINLYKLNNYYCKNFQSGTVVNVDFPRLYEYLTENILKKKFKLDTENIFVNFVCSFEKKQKLLPKIVFDEFLQKLNLIDIYNKSAAVYSFIANTKTRFLTTKASENLEKNILYCFIKKYCEDFIETNNISRHEVAETINFNEEKNTLLVVIKVKNNEVVLRIFNSGKIVVVGSESAKEIEFVQQELEKIFTEFIYVIDDFKLLTIEEILMDKQF